MHLHHGEILFVDITIVILKKCNFILVKKKL